MAVFPQLGLEKFQTGLPYRTSMEFDTVVADVGNGRRFTFSRRTNPVALAVLNLPVVTDAERDVLLAFFDARKQAYESFTFLDPAGNLVPSSADFSVADWTKSNVSVGAAATDPVGQSNATTLTASGAGHIETTVVSVGGVSGYRLCLSAWCKAAASSQTLETSFRDSGGARDTKVHSLPQDIWMRVIHSFEFDTANAVVIRFGGGGTWDGTTIDFFGAQCVPMIGPGAYSKSPANHGERTVRFDGPFVERFVDAGVSAVSVPVREVGT